MWALRGRYTPQSLYEVRLPADVITLIIDFTRRHHHATIRDTTSRYVTDHNIFDYAISRRQFSFFHAFIRHASRRRLPLLRRLHRSPSYVEYVVYYCRHFIGDVATPLNMLVVSLRKAPLALQHAAMASSARGREGALIARRPRSCRMPFCAYAQKRACLLLHSPAARAYAQ